MRDPYVAQTLRFYERRNSLRAPALVDFVQRRRIERRRSAQSAFHRKGAALNGNGLRTRQQMQRERDRGDHESSIAASRLSNASLSLAITPFGLPGFAPRSVHAASMTSASASNIAATR